MGFTGAARQLDATAYVRWKKSKDDGAHILFIFLVHSFYLFVFYSVLNNYLETFMRPKHFSDFLFFVSLWEFV